MTRAEVSITQPPQAIRTSPGWSDSHTAPSAIRAMRAKAKRSRIMMPPLFCRARRRHFEQAGDGRFDGKPPLRLFKPCSRRRGRRAVKTLNLGDRARKVVVGQLLLGAGDQCVHIVAVGAINAAEFYQRGDAV